MTTTIPKEVIERWLDPTPISLEPSLSKKVSVSDAVLGEWVVPTPVYGLWEGRGPEGGKYSYLRGFCEGIGIHVSPELWEWKKEREDDYEGIPF